MKLILIIVLLLFVSGCSNIHIQDGVNLNNAASYVTITTDSENNAGAFAANKKLVITSINGENLYRFGWDFNYPDIVHATEGLHIIEVKLNYKNLYADGCLWFDSKIGENYIVKQEMLEYSVLFWIENIESAERVGGICGSEPS